MKAIVVSKNPAYRKLYGRTFTVMSIKDGNVDLKVEMKGQELELRFRYSDVFIVSIDQELSNLQSNSMSSSAIALHIELTDYKNHLQNQVQS